MVARASSGAPVAMPGGWKATRGTAFTATSPVIAVIETFAVNGAMPHAGNAGVMPSIVVALVTVESTDAVADVPFSNGVPLVAVNVTVAGWPTRTAQPVPVAVKGTE